MQQQHAVRSPREIQRNDDARPAGIPPGYVGLATIPGTLRRVYWTGKVAVGLRYQSMTTASFGMHAELIQTALLSGRSQRQG